MSNLGIHRRTPILVTPSLTARFWANVFQPEELDACWRWTGTDRGNGYGVIKAGGKLVSAHRVAYVIQHGAEPPEGRIVCHTCDHRWCVRGSHLYAGTPKENSDDMDRAGARVVICGESHPAAKLTADVVRLIRLSAGRIPQRSLAQMYGVNRSTIAEIQQGKCWRHVI